LGNWDLEVKAEHQIIMTIKIAGLKLKVYLPKHVHPHPKK
jgi:hypothetical protein